MSMSTNSRFYRFLTGKGFYVALIACLLGAGIAVWAGIQQSLGSTEEPLPNIEQNFSEPAPLQPQAQDVGEAVPDVSKATPVPQQDPEPKQPVSSDDAEPAVQEPAEPAAVEQEEIPLPVSVSYTLPLDGECFLPFSEGKLVKSATLADWRTHDGIDIRAESGEKVCAMADGTITRVSTDALWGTVMEITHADSTVTRYCGLAEELILNEGQNVKQGDTIGTVGHITCESADGPHLHLEVVQEGQLVDPLTLLTA